jgi:hypothetical protein
MKELTKSDSTIESQQDFEIALLDIEGELARMAYCLISLIHPDDLLSGHLDEANQSFTLSKYSKASAEIRECQSQISMIISAIQRWLQKEPQVKLESMRVFDVIAGHTQSVVNSADRYAYYVKTAKTAMPSLASLCTSYNDSLKLINSLIDDLNNISGAVRIEYVTLLPDSYLT